MLVVCPDEVHAIKSVFSSTISRERFALLQGDALGIDLRHWQRTLKRHQVQVVLVGGEVDSSVVDICMQEGIVVASGVSKSEMDAVSRWRVVL